MTYPTLPYIRQSIITNFPLYTIQSELLASQIYVTISSTSRPYIYRNVLSHPPLHSYNVHTYTTVHTTQYLLQPTLTYDTMYPPTQKYIYCSLPLAHTYVKISEVCVCMYIVGVFTTLLIL